MARSYSATTDQIVATSPWAGLRPLSVSGWFNTTLTVTGGSLFTTGNPGFVAASCFDVAVGTSGTRKVAASDCNFGFTATVNQYTASTWSHFGAWSSSNDTGGVVLNGDWANRAQAAIGALTPAGTKFIIGNGNSGSNNLGGSLAELAVWNAKLGQDEFLALAAGTPAFLIRPK